MMQNYEEVLFSCVRDTLVHRVEETRKDENVYCV